MGIQLQNAEVITALPDDAGDNDTSVKRSRWTKIREVIWDGERSPEERKLVQRLDLFIMYDQL